MIHQKPFAAEQVLSMDQVSDALLKMAELAAQHPQYLSLYERMEKEFLIRQSSENVLERAKRLAGSATPNAIPIV